MIGIDAHDAVLASAKAGIGIEDVLERVVRDIPAPAGNPDGPLKALLFDSWYDPYRGVACMIRVIDGTLKKGEKIQLMASKRVYAVDELGIFSPKAAGVPGNVSGSELAAKPIAAAGLLNLITDRSAPIWTAGDPV